MVQWSEVLQRLLLERFALFLAIFVVLLGLVFGYLVNRFIKRVLNNLGLGEAVEGTPFERSLQGVGTSTVSLIAFLTGLFIVVSAAFVSFRLVGLLSTELLVARVTEYFPSVFIAALALIFGLVVGDKAALLTSERLRSVKLPETGIIPTLVKYSVIYVAVLVALGQLGVAVAALVVLLGAYAFGIVFLGGLAFKDLLAASAAGVYLLLNQPYSIGDEVRIDGNQGIVQEVDVFVTHIESEEEEFVVPNHHVFRGGVVRVLRD